MLHEVIDLTEPKRLNLPLNDNYRVLRWDDGKVYISYTKQGNAVSMHIAAEGKGKRHLREAANAFCEAVFSEFKWCQMIIGVVGPQSVVNLAIKCGFKILKKGDKDGHTVTLVARVR